MRPAPRAVDAFGSEDPADVTGDPWLMRTIALQTADSRWYGGAVYTSRVHFDVPEAPRRRNVVLVRGLGALPGSPADAPFSESAAGPPGPAGGAGVLARIDREDAALVFDGARWLRVGSARCAAALGARFVTALTEYLARPAHPLSVHDVGPALLEITDEYRAGSGAHHAALSEAVSGVLDAHAVSPEEFSDEFGSDPWAAPAAPPGLGLKWGRRAARA